MYRPLFLIILGAGLVLHGMQELREMTKVAVEPVKHKLAKLERRDRPTNVHVEFGEHVRLYDYAVISYEEPETGIQGKRPPPDAVVRYCYVPVFSKEYQASLKKKRKAAAVKGHPVKMDRMALVIKTTEFKKYSEIPVRPKNSESVSGMLVTTLDKLPEEERSQINKAFQCPMPERVFILEENAQLPSQSLPRTLLFGGIVLLSGGTFSLARRVMGKKEVATDSGQAT